MFLITKMNSSLPKTFRTNVHPVCMHDTGQKSPLDAVGFQTNEFGLRRKEGINITKYTVTIAILNKVMITQVQEQDHATSPH